VNAALTWIEKSDINKYNINSVSTAKLGTVVVGALAGKKARTSIEDFLPFDTKRIKKNTGITDESVSILQHLMKTEKMDGRVIGMLVEELKTAALRNDGE